MTLQPAGVGIVGAQPFTPARLEAALALLAQHAPAFRLKIGDDGRIRASLFRCEIGSHFQPVVEAARNSRVFGHQTRLCASESRPKPLTVNEITDIARSCDVLAQLQWLDVALHAANYFGHAPASYALFVSPAAELFTNARQLSGRLRALLDSLGVAPQRLVVRIPDRLIVSLKLTGPLLQAVAEHGFGISLGLPKRFDLLRKLEQQQRIDFVQLDPVKRARDSNLPLLLTQIRSIGATPLCHGILDPRNNEKLADAGAGLLVGLGIAPPSAHIHPGVLPPFPWAGV